MRCPDPDTKPPSWLDAWPLGPLQLCRSSSHHMELPFGPKVIQSETNSGRMQMQMLRYKTWFWHEFSLLLFSQLSNSTQPQYHQSPNLESAFINQIAHSLLDFILTFHVIFCFQYGNGHWPWKTLPVHRWVTRPLLPVAFLIVFDSGLPADAAVAQHARSWASRCQSPWRVHVWEHTWRCDGFGHSIVISSQIISISRNTTISTILQTCGFWENGGTRTPSHLQDTAQSPPVPVVDLVRKLVLSHLPMTRLPRMAYNNSNNSNDSNSSNILMWHIVTFWWAKKRCWVLAQARTLSKCQQKCKQNLPLANGSQSILGATLVAFSDPRCEISWSNMGGLRWLLLEGPT